MPQPTLTHKIHSRAWCRRCQALHRLKQWTWMLWILCQSRNGDLSQHQFSCQTWTKLKWASLRCKILCSQEWCIQTKTQTRSLPLWLASKAWHRPKRNTRPTEPLIKPRSQKVTLDLTPTTCTIRSLSQWSRSSPKWTEPTRLRATLSRKQFKLPNLCLKTDSERHFWLIFKINFNSI